MKVVDTYVVTISIGSMYEAYGTTLVKSKEEVYRLIQEYVNEIGLCVSVTDTQFIYTNGSEPGYLIQLINYPRFPSTINEIENRALGLVQVLKKELHQKRVSIIFPDKTLMVE